MCGGTSIAGRVVMHDWSAVRSMCAHTLGERKPVCRSHFFPALFLLAGFLFVCKLLGASRFHVSWLYNNTQRTHKHTPAGTLFG